MSEIRFDHLAPDDYERAKRVFDAAKHPGFIGRELVFRAAKQGQAVIAVLEGADVGVALVAKEKLLALSVALSAQGRGIGPALMRHTKPAWVSAIETRVGFFEKLGYSRVGAPKVGQNGKHATQLMQLTHPEAMARGGPVSPPTTGAATPRQPAEPPPPSAPTLLDLVGTIDASPSETAYTELVMLDGMYGAAVLANKFSDAMAILDRAKRIARRG